MPFPVPPLTDSASSAALMKWIGFAVVLAAGAFLIVRGDYERGAQAVGLALWIGGATSSIQSLRSDVTTIKQSPNTPGVPLGEPKP